MKSRKDMLDYVDNLLSGVRTDFKRAVDELDDVYHDMDCLEYSIGELQKEIDLMKNGGGVKMSVADGGVEMSVADAVRSEMLDELVSELSVFRVDELVQLKNSIMGLVEDYKLNKIKVK